jgi:hypothetical protein
MESFGGIGVVGFFILGIAQVVAGYAGISQGIGTIWAIAAVAVAFLFRFTLPLTIGSFFGAMNVWGWNWFASALFALPGLVFVIPGVIMSMVSYGREVATTAGTRIRTSGGLKDAVIKEGNRAVNKAFSLKAKKDIEYVEGASGVEWTDGDRRLFGWMRSGLFFVSVLLGLVSAVAAIGMLGESSSNSPAALAGIWSLFYCVFMPFKYIKIADAMQSKIKGSFKRARRWYIVDILLFICGNFMNPVCWISFVVKFISYRKITRSIAIQSVYSDEWYA